MVRIGLINSSHFGDRGFYQKVVCCTFSAYHAVKANVRSGLIHAQHDISYDTLPSAGPTLRVAWQTYADAFRAEACDFYIPCRFFSVPKFISFLTTGNQIEEPLIQPSRRHYEPHLNSNRTRTRTRTGTVPPISSRTSGVHTASRSSSINFSLASDANAQNPVLHHY